MGAYALTTCDSLLPAATPDIWLDAILASNGLWYMMKSVGRESFFFVGVRLESKLYLALLG